MVVGILQFELLIHDPESLKDKRRVVRSVKDRLHRQHQVSVAEVACQDRMDLAMMGLALVGPDGRRVGQVLDQIIGHLRHLRDAELGATSRDIVQGIERSQNQDQAGLEKESLARELLAFFEDSTDAQQEGLS